MLRVTPALLFLFLISCEGGRRLEPVRNPAQDLVARIGVIGASASGGFGTDLPFSAVIGCAIQVPREITAQTHTLFFVWPERIGKNQVAQVLESQPSLVLALDFLFWFAYGRKPLEQRRHDLKVGFQLLESFQVPLFVGDIPDMRGASVWALPPSKIPPAEELDLLNEQVHAWVETRPTLFLLPLARWAQQMRSGETLPVQNTTPTTDSKKLLTGDRLHPSVTGQVYLTLLTLDVIEKHYPGLERLRVHDPDQLQQCAEKWLTQWRDARKSSSTR
ncbi:MAG: hypothetical protein V3T77_07635 [Planctomycetota bacterium]